MFDNVILRANIQRSQISVGMVIHAGMHVTLTEHQAIRMAHFNGVVSMLLVDVAKVLFRKHFRPFPGRRDMRSSQHVKVRSVLHQKRKLESMNKIYQRANMSLTRSLSLFFHCFVRTKNAEPLHKTSMSFIPNSGTQNQVVIDTANFRLPNISITVDN